MRLFSSVIVFFILTLFSACNLTEDEGALRIFSYTYDFSDSQHDWQSGFADFPSDPKDTAFFVLRSNHIVNPADPASGKKSLMLSGNNKNEDLFMYLKRRVDGLEPNTIYYVTFEVELTSDARNGLAGSAGPEGKNVYLKVGATETEPKSVIDQNYVRMNIDKGDRSENGEDMVRIGDIAVADSTAGYTIINRSNSPYSSSYSNPLVIQSNNNGELWLVVGTESEYKGTTTIYYTKISAVFSKSN
jgi:hypothetical protein